MTCEGNFILVFQYHIRLLSHFLGKPLNLPFYLKMYLVKMANAAEKWTKNIDENLHHHGLIRIIMCEALS